MIRDAECYRVFEEAGQLAAYYSKGREADKVEIDYLEKRNVKKPNGAKPGFVVRNICLGQIQNGLVHIFQGRDSPYGP